jgi:hypothetical protein
LGATWSFAISVCQLLVGHGTADLAWLGSSLNHPCKAKVTVVVVERQMSFFSNRKTTFEKFGKELFPF